MPKKNTRNMKKLKSVNQLKHEALHRDYHNDVGTAARFTKKAGDGLMFMSSVAESAGQPEIGVPLLMAGGGALATNYALHKVRRSKLLKKPKKSKKT